LKNGRYWTRTPSKNQQKTGVSESGGAEYGALPATYPITDPELAELIDVWPDLPVAMRHGIMAMIQAITEEDR
jgi:hypothetical protein